MNAINGYTDLEECARQEDFIRKCLPYVEALGKKLGHTPTMFVRNLGCQMNARDAEKLRGILKSIGYEEAGEEEAADLILYNTCTVRDNANQKVYGRLGVLSTVKKRRPEVMVGLCGCMMQETAVIEKIKKSYGFVDLIFGTHNIFKLAELLYRTFSEENMVIDIWEKTEQIVEKLPNDRKYFYKSGVNIMFGCNNFCSYCIVPYARGRERSREPEEILEEIRRLASDGVVEIMLLGQNVNSYGKNLPEPISFAELLRRIEQEIPQIRRIRFMTSHPKDLSDELIQTMKESKKICKHLHLPLQSGSSRILEAMNRKYSKEQYLALVDKIREAIPDISLTTDIIVGFPGEQEEDFEETLDVVRKVEYDTAFTFIYSKRSNTPAAKMENQIPQEVVGRRFQTLLEEVQKIGKKRAEKLTGRVEEVLVEECNKQDESLMTGRLSNNLLVHFPGDASMLGEFYQVRLSECKGFYFMGEIVDEI